MRNYKAMGNEKLQREAAICPEEDRQVVEALLAERNLALPAHRCAKEGMAWQPPKPMLAQSAKTVPDIKDAVMEPKLDGWRLFIVKRNDKVICYTRTGKSMSSLPYLNKAFDYLPNNTIIDGEIVDLTTEPGQEWNRVQELCSRDEPHRPSNINPALTYVAFDILEYGGHDIRRSKFSQRRKILAEVLLDGLEKIANYVQIISQMPVSQETYEQMADEGYEGVIIKLLSDYYCEGVRRLIKVKPKQTSNATITGTFAPKAGSKYDGNAVGGITFIVKWSNGKTFEGRAAGMNDTLRKELNDNPQTFNGRKVEIEHGGISKDWTLRFPRFKRFLSEDVAEVEDV